LIKSPQTDLTIDKKFSKDVDDFTDSRLIRNPRESIFSKYIKPSWDLPWVKRIMEVGNQDKLSHRSYGDPLSDDCNTTLRVTEDNTILMLGQQLRINLLQDLLLEVVGWFPYESTSICLHCGRKRIRSLKYKNAYGFCSQHGHRENRIPWIRRI